MIGVRAQQVFLFGFLAFAAFFPYADFEITSYHGYEDQVNGHSSHQEQHLGGLGYVAMLATNVGMTLV